MVKKIKKPKTREEKKAEKEAAAAERERQAEGIQDEFQAKGKEVAQLVGENSKFVIGFIAVVLLVGAGLGLFTMTSSASNLSASILYSEALETYQAPIGEALPGEDADVKRFATEKERAEKAREMFRRVVDKEGTTGAAILSRLYIGHTSVALGEQDEALAAYDDFLATAKRTDVLYYAGLDGRAMVLEGKGDVPGAITTLEQRMTNGSPVAADAALLTLARLYKAQGNTARVKELLEKFGAEHGESPLKTDADELLASLPRG